MSASSSPPRKLIRLSAKRIGNGAFCGSPSKPETGRGMIMSEGAGAVLLKRSDDGGVPSVEAAMSAARIEQIVPGSKFLPPFRSFGES